MNTSVLEESELRQMLSNFILAARRHPLWERDKLKWWDDVFKLGIKKITVDYCRQKKKWKDSTSRFFQACLKEEATLVYRHRKAQKN